MPRRLFKILCMIAVMSFNVHLQSARAQVQSNKSQVSDELQNAVNLTFGSPRDARASLSWVEARGGTDMVAHLITAMRFSSLPRGAFVSTLQYLTGDKERSSWFDWMLWQQSHSDVVPHDSYLTFKSQVFYRIDPAFKRFFRPDMAFDIRPEEIVWGGVRVDGIPALDNPKHLSVEKASYLKDDDEVFGVAINGDVRAYPLRIMGWHEMFNDVVGGVPVSLAYCTLCNAGILFEGDYEGREAFGVDEPFTFGSSGFLYQSNKLMYDRNTDSLWNQFTGQPVAGKLRDSGISLKVRPVVITTWKDWKAKHPDTKVLSLDTGFRRDYGSGVVYQEYFASPDLMFPALGDESDKFQEKEQIFGLRLEGGVKSWPLDRFKGGAVINDKVGVVNVVLIGDDKTRTVRAYARDDFQFDGNSQSLQTADGQSWTLSEDFLTAKDGHKLKRLPGHIAYWFAWAGYFGEEQ